MFLFLFYVDINECYDPTLNDCERSCVNTQGSYRCVCPKGHHGDGKKGRQGCIAGKPLVIQVTIGK